MGLFGGAITLLSTGKDRFYVIPLFKNLVNLLLTKEIFWGGAESKCDEMYDSFHYNNDHIETL